MGVIIDKYWSRVKSNKQKFNSTFDEGYFRNSKIKVIKNGVVLDKRVW